MSALDGLHVQIEPAIDGVRADGGIARVGKRARLPVAQTGYIKLVTTEVLTLSSSNKSARTTKQSI